MKQAVLKLMLSSGAFAPFRFANRGKVLIVMYHRFGKTRDGGAKTSVRDFSDHLEYLTTRYNVVPLSLVAERLLSGEPLPRRAAVITIDDGYRDAHTFALPVLRRFGARATLFVTTGFLDGACWLWTDKLRYLTAHARAETLEATVAGRDVRLALGGEQSRREAASRCNELLKTLPDEEKDETIERVAHALGVELPDAPPEEFAPLTWDEARELDSSLVEIGSHTVTHPVLTNVSDERLAREMNDSRARLEGELGREVKLFCYPNGGEDARVREAVRHAGYVCAVTTEPGLNDAGANPLALRRMPAEPDLAHFAQDTSGFELLKNRLRPRREREVESA